MLARSFLIKSSSKLLVTRTGIKAWMSLISGRIRLLTLELLALEWRKVYTFELEYLWGQLANLDQILCVASLGVEKGYIMFWGRLDQDSGFHGNRKPLLTFNGENGVSNFSRLLLIRSFLYLLVARTCIKSQTSLNFGQIRPLTMKLAAPWALKKFPIDLKWENGVSMLARSFLVKLSSKLLVTRTGIKAWMSFISGRIRLLTLELLALEWRKVYTFELEYLWSQLASLDQILCSIIGVGERLHKVLGQIDLGTLDSGERSLPFGLLVIWAVSWENLSSGVCDQVSSNRPAQLQRLAWVLKVWI